jgi:hypothetical protein
MQVLRRSIVLPLFAAFALAASWAHAADYRLVPTPTAPLETEFAPQAPSIGWGPLQFARTTSSTGNGLSLQAGERWFGRVGVGRSLVERDAVSVGGGYRFGDNESLSMHLTRQFGQERLGLALRYDWSRTYLRLSYEPPPRLLGPAERGVRFSAGMRF